MRNAVENVSESLVYERVGGNPIYHKGYREFLFDSHKSDEPTGSSLPQLIVIHVC